MSSRADCAEGAGLFSFRPEVAEAGEEVEDMMEVIGVEDLPHVVYIKMEMIILILQGIINAISGMRA